MDANTLYRRWLFDAWSGDYGVLDEILTPGFAGHWPRMDVRGPGGAAEQIRRSRAYFSDIENTLDVGPLVDGDLVAARWTFHGSYQGGIPGATAGPGTRISFAGHDLFRMEDGRFAEYWPVSDALGMMQSLGAL
ncbi:ester cyclase [Actinomadura montaniterrae]|uniref:Ester cyclase n=1 Tax=Actinomadura montaniterrae TaxID=1803903 RepID=A0A6L3VM79_9ACTN|nr:ester cyclase [Actinomadura montaniterrae]KAB2373636.1 ester cyclase [Actinomadura montaniterrae]